MNILNQAYADLSQRIEAAAKRAGHPVRLLAVSKTKPAAAISDLAAQGQRAFGENYVQEGFQQQELAGLALEWHLIGPLQSNKWRGRHSLDWLQSLDREKLIAPLNRIPPCQHGATQRADPGQHR